MLLFFVCLCLIQIYLSIFNPKGSEDVGKGAITHTTHPQTNLLYTVTPSTVSLLLLRYP